MLECLEMLPPDPILGLSAEFKADPNPAKVNLGVGVYKDDAGITPVFGSIKTAERNLLEAQDTKAYIGQAGDPHYIAGVTRVVLGEELSSKHGSEISGVMTPGGSGALRMLAGLIVSSNPEAVVWTSSPTWGNHKPLLESAGVTLSSYRYYNAETGLVEFEEMLEDLGSAKPGDLVLLHACCHNPTGADLTQEQWDRVIAFCKDKQLVPFLDSAYQGLGVGLDEDAYGMRKAVEVCPEVLIAVSSSKNFGVYRERAGLAMVKGTAETAPIAQSHIMSVARRTYSMSAYHGAAVVGAVLADPILEAQWRSELAEARNRINDLRSDLANRLNESQAVRDFSYLVDNKGMFSILGLSADQAKQMRSEHAVYILNSSRINLAGLQASNLDTVVKAVVSVLN